MTDLHPRHIRAGRALVGATQQDLASAAKLSLATLNNIEREVAHPRSKTLDQIRRALLDGGVDIRVEGSLERLSMERDGEIVIEDDSPIRSTLLRLIDAKNLLKVEQIYVFSIKKEYHRCGILLQGAYRQAIYTNPGIDMRNRIGLAELSVFVVSAFKSVQQRLHFLEDVVDFDALQLEGSDLIRRLPHDEKLAGFLDGQFPESQAIIEAAKNSEQHPLSHVLRIFEKI